MAGCGFLAGSYITDGSSLFHIEHTHVDPGSGRLFLELEDCVTMELSACPADALAARPVRSVTPSEAAHLIDAALA